MTWTIRLQEAFKLALSMTLVYGLALWMDWDLPKYAALAVALVAGPVYLRNLWLTGSPVPMTRDEGVVARIEAGRQRRKRYVDA